MRKSSMLHLIAISGLHISFISLLFFRGIFFIFLLMNHFVFGKLRYFVLKKISLLISLVAAFSYLVVSGFSVSGWRAFIMFFVYIMHHVFLAQVIFSRIIFYSVIIFGLIHPSQILNPGLQMSFLAVIGLFVFSNKKIYLGIKSMTRKINCANWIQNWVALILKILIGSAGPHLLTLPVSAFYFLQITTYTFIANILAVPFMSLVIAPLIILYFFIQILGIEILNSHIKNFLNLSFEFLKKISSFFANSAPYNSLYVEQISKTSFVLFFFGICMLFVWKKRSGILFSLVFIFFGLIFGKFQETTPDLFVLKEKNIDNYFFFNKKEKIIYFFPKNQTGKTEKKAKINYFLAQRFSPKYNFVQIDKLYAEKLMNLYEKNPLSYTVYRNID
jgi:competence protein ComEC